MIHNNNKKEITWTIIIFMKNNSMINKFMKIKINQTLIILIKNKILMNN